VSVALSVVVGIATWNVVVGITADLATGIAVNMVFVALGFYHP